MRQASHSASRLDVGDIDSGSPKEPLPLVSIVIPCRNEASYIGPCLESILASEYAPDRLEVLIADGRSDDGTREVIREFTAKHPSVRMVDNDRQVTPTAMNAAIAVARGDVIMLLSAHSTIPPLYVRTLVDSLITSGADAVGGVVMTRPGNNTVIARAIAAAMAHPFGVGNSYYRIGIGEPRWVDTVPFGCYRRQVFDRIGLFDEDLVRNQDDEFNMRLLMHGGRLLLVPHVVSEYFARDSLAKLWRMFYQYGYFKPLVVQKVGAVLTARQVVPAALVAGMALSALVPLAAPRYALGAVAVPALYAVGCAAAGMALARRHGLFVGASTVLVFFVLHFSYGAGYLKGLLDFFAGGRRMRDGRTVPLSR
ncbi:MAG: glycosyltransferase family 2 protein [Gemmatimonadaceae bacterium]